MFKLSVSNPKSKYVAYLSVLSQISNCQSLGRKNKHKILKTDRKALIIGNIHVFKQIHNNKAPTNKGKHPYEESAESDCRGARAPPRCGRAGALAKLPFLSPSNFRFHLLKSLNVLLGFFTYLLSTLCGPVVSSTGAHEFVLIS